VDDKEEEEELKVGIIEEVPVKGIKYKLRVK
jgi:hypothetical protein